MSAAIATAARNVKGNLRSTMAPSPGVVRGMMPQSICWADQAPVVRPVVPAAASGGSLLPREAFQVSPGIGRRAVALRAPHGFREAFDRLVQRFVPFLSSQKQFIEKARDARRLVDRELLFERHVQAHVEERIRFVGVVDRKSTRLN